MEQVLQLPLLRHIYLRQAGLDTVYILYHCFDHAWINSLWLFSIHFIDFLLHQIEGLVQVFEILVKELLLFSLLIDCLLDLLLNSGNLLI